MEHVQAETTKPTRKRRKRAAGTTAASSSRCSRSKLPRNVTVVGHQSTAGWWLAAVRGFSSWSRAMFIEDLNEHEIGMLVVALKHWRAKRQDTRTRHTDPVLTNDTVSLLLAKLESNLLTSLTPKRAPLRRALRR